MNIYANSYEVASLMLQTEQTLAKPSVYLRHKMG